MKYYIILYGENVTLYSCIEDINKNELKIDGFIEISKNDWDKFYKGISENKILYIDNKKTPQLRDRFTKWDKTTESWIPDEEAIANNKIELLKSQAQQALNETNIYSDPAYRIRLSKEENKINDTYRAQLYDILENKYNGTELPINPNLLKG